MRLLQINWHKVVFAEMSAKNCVDFRVAGRCDYACDGNNQLITLKPILPKSMNLDSYAHSCLLPTPSDTSEFPGSASQSGQF